MLGELDVLRVVSQRLVDVGIDFMLTGSFAMAFYATPRMTRDLDFVIALAPTQVGALVAAFDPDFYIDADDVRSAVHDQRIFNMMHLESGIKVDMIIQKRDTYRCTEFERRCEVSLGDVQTCIVSREDLILSKLVWARDGGSELQRRDVRALLSGKPDRDYLERWAQALEVTSLLAEIEQ